MKKTALPRIEKFPPAKQRSMDELLDKNREGSITPQERKKLERLVAEAEQLMVANGKRLVKFAKRDAAGAPGNAVPVTVWVKPEHAGH
jgi:hypothetical protein